MTTSDLIFNHFVARSAFAASVMLDRTLVGHWPLLATHIQTRHGWAIVHRDANCCDVCGLMPDQAEDFFKDQDFVQYWLGETDKMIRAMERAVGKQRYALDYNPDPGPTDAPHGIQFIRREFVLHPVGFDFNKDWHVQQRTSGSPCNVQLALAKNWMRHL